MTDGKGSDQENSSHRDSTHGECLHKWWGAKGASAQASQRSDRDESEIQGPGEHFNAESNSGNHTPQPEHVTTSRI